MTRFVEHYLEAEWPDTWKTAKWQLETYFAPKFSGRSLASTERHELSAIFDALRSTPAAAHNVHAVVRKQFRWAVNSRDLSASPIADVTAPPAVMAHNRVLTPDELVAAWKASYSLNDPAGAWLRILIATLQQRTEASGLSWPELNHNAQTWLLPGKRAKNDYDHIVPLNALTVADLDDLGWKRKGLLFTTKGTTPISGFTKIKAALDKAMLPLLQKMADDRAEALGEDSVPRRGAALDGPRHSPRRHYGSAIARYSDRGDGARHQPHIGRNRRHSGRLQSPRLPRREACRAQRLGGISSN